MSQSFNSDYKDTFVAKKFLKKYKMASLLSSLGIFLILVAIIPYLLIQTDNINNRIIASLIIGLVGLVLVFIGNFRKNSLRSNNNNKYTVTALDFISDQKKEVGRFYRRDIIIGILLVIIAPIIYFLIHFRASFLPETVNSYVTSVLILILAIGVFLIINTKGKRDAYTYVLENI